MRVAIIGPFALYPKGTVLVRILPIAKTLKDRGHEIAVFLPPYDNLRYSGRHLTLEGIDIYNVKMVRMCFPFNYIFVTVQLITKALTFRPHIIHVFKPKGYSGLAAMFLILLKKVKLVTKPLVVDSDDWEGRGGFGGFYIKNSIYPRVIVSFLDFQERWITRRADALTVASKMLEKQTILFRIPSEKVFYIPNGPHLNHFIVETFADTQRFKKRSETGNGPIILLYTRFLEFKVEKVIDVLIKVREKSRNVKLLVIGKGMFHEEDNLLRLAKERKIEDALIYVGWVRPKDIPYYFALGDVAIYPYDDTLLNRSKCPGKLVELMGAGKSVVAEHVGQIGEYIVDGESGILVTPGDNEMFAEKILEVLENSRLRTKLGKNAKQRIWSHFALDKQITMVEEAYRVSMEGHLRKNEKTVFVS